MVGIDGSQISVSVLAEAVCLAMMDGGAIHAVSVVETAPDILRPGPGFNDTAARSRTTRAIACAAFARAHDLFILTNLAGETPPLDADDTGIAALLRRQSKAWAQIWWCLENMAGVVSSASGSTVPPNHFCAAPIFRCSLCHRGTVQKAQQSSVRSSLRQQLSETILGLAMHSICSGREDGHEDRLRRISHPRRCDGWPWQVAITCCANLRIERAVPRHAGRPRQIVARAAKRAICRQSLRGTVNTPGNGCSRKRRGDQARHVGRQPAGLQGIQLQASERD